MSLTKILFADTDFLLEKHPEKLYDNIGVLYMWCVFGCTSDAKTVIIGEGGGI